MSEKWLGKITRCEFGYGGYQDAMVGISFTMSGEEGCISDFWGWWGGTRSEYCKWSEEDRDKLNAEMVKRIDKVLLDAKKTSISQLVNVPVEIETENRTLKAWRVLTEVI